MEEHITIHNEQALLDKIAKLEKHEADLIRLLTESRAMVSVLKEVISDAMGGR